MPGKSGETSAPSVLAAGPGTGRTAATGGSRVSLEQAVTRIWCEVLELPASELGEDFMASGGDSVQLLQLLARVKEDFGVELPLLAFLSEPTIESIVDRIAATEG